VRFESTMLSTRVCNYLIPSPSTCQPTRGYCHRGRPRMMVSDGGCTTSPRSTVSAMLVCRVSIGPFIAASSQCRDSEVDGEEEGSTHHPEAVELEGHCHTVRRAEEVRRSQEGAVAVRPPQEGTVVAAALQSLPAAVLGGLAHAVVTVLPTLLRRHPCLLILVS
jgi:hypothetical protein